jgi:DNA mismatch endonuclease, patch repair protein
MIITLTEMTDVHNIEIRSYNMSQIKGTNTKPEMLVRKFLFSKGFRYKINDRKLPGKPDIVLPKYKTIIFVNGCFWHGHENCKYFKIPVIRKEWWLEKINNTKQRDTINKTVLNELGWTVYTIWTCEINKDGSGALKKIIDEIRDEKY